MHIDCSLLYQHAITTSTGPQTQPTFDDKHKKWGEIRINLQATVQGKPAKTEEDPPASQDVAAGWMRGPWDERSSLAWCGDRNFCHKRTKGKRNRGVHSSNVFGCDFIISGIGSVDLWIWAQAVWQQTADGMFDGIHRTTLYTTPRMCSARSCQGPDAPPYTRVRPRIDSESAGKRERESNGYGPGR